MELAVNRGDCAEMCAGVRMELMEMRDEICSLWSIRNASRKEKTWFESTRGLMMEEGENKIKSFRR